MTGRRVPFASASTRTYSRQAELRRLLQLSRLAHDAFTPVDHSLEYDRIEELRERDAAARLRRACIKKGERSNLEGERSNFEGEFGYS